MSDNRITRLLRLEHHFNKNLPEPQPADSGLKKFNVSLFLNYFPWITVGIGHNELSINRCCKQVGRILWRREKIYLREVSRCDSFGIKIPRLVCLQLHWEHESPHTFPFILSSKVMSGSKSKLGDTSSLSPTLIARFLDGNEFGQNGTHWKQTNTQQMVWTQVYLLIVQSAAPNESTPEEVCLW